MISNAKDAETKYAILFIYWHELPPMHWVPGGQHP